MENRNEISGISYLDLVPVIGITPQLCRYCTRRDRAGRASAIAEAAFLKHTKHAIGDYSVHPGKHTPTEWHFLVSGEKSCLRPGNHWDVSVNRATGGTTIVDGL